MIKESSFRPLLAFDASWDDLARLLDRDGYLLASAKLDGIRAIVRNGQLVSRTLKPIRNKHIQSQLGREEFEGLDGELVVGDAKGEGVFARTSSGVMSEGGTPNFVYWVFDDWTRKDFPFHDYRKKQLIPRFLKHQDTLNFLPHLEVRNLGGLEALEEEFVSTGYEGVILRSPHAPYKYGRSTAREGYLAKLKRFQDSEAVILGFEPLYHNTNEAELDHLGLQKRSSHKDNKIADALLGALIVQDVHHPEWTFNIGTGFTYDDRQKMWAAKDQLLFNTVKYKFLSVGMVDVPRHPVYLGLRDPEDIG
jgi:DNA ligase-1